MHLTERLLVSFGTLSELKSLLGSADSNEGVLEDQHLIFPLHPGYPFSTRRWTIMIL